MKKQNKNKNKQRGFTLIEIMIVVAIIGILSSLILPKIMGKPGEARTQKAKHDIRMVSSALNLYKLDNFNYPSTDDGLEKLVNKYLDKVPLDPWSQEYKYLSPGNHREFDLYSYGLDNQEGGELENIDITNWQ